METVAVVEGDIGVKPACEALGLSRATYYRNKADGGTGGKSTPASRSSSRALSSEERKEVLDLMHRERFMDQAPREIYATLLDEGRYVCSVRTMEAVPTGGQGGRLLLPRDQAAVPGTRFHSGKKGAIEFTNL